jgi:perosamine synthetase
MVSGILSSFPNPREDSVYHPGCQRGCRPRRNLGLDASQLRKRPGWLGRRREIAGRYDRALAGVAGVRPLAVRAGVEHAYQLYVVRLDSGRGAVFAGMRAAGVGVNVHYIPVHLHPYYRQRYGTGPGLCPVAEAASEEILSLPIFPAMTDADVDFTLAALGRCHSAPPTKGAA